MWKVIKNIKLMCISQVFASCLLFTAYAQTSDKMSHDHSYIDNEHYEKQYVLNALVDEESGAYLNVNHPVGTPATFTYGFNSDEFGYFSESESYVKRAFYEYEKLAIKNALTHFSSVAGLTFVEVDKIADADFSFAIGGDDVGAGAYSGTQGDNIIRAAYFGEKSYLRYLDPAREANYIKYRHYDTDFKHDYAVVISTILHEVGHILGLRHPFDMVSPPSDEFPNGQWESRLAESESNKHFTVMEYNTNCAFDRCFFSHVLSKYDVVALQYLYGKNQITNLEDNIYKFDDSFDTFQLIHDVSGNDTISVENSDRQSIIDLRELAFSSIAPLVNKKAPVGYYHSFEHADENGNIVLRSKNSLAIALGTLIENAEGGSNNDELIGNEQANNLIGNKGNDFFSGLGGDDFIDGGDGLDKVNYPLNKSDYQIENNGGVITVTALQSNEGVDILNSIELIQFADELIDLSSNTAPVIQSFTDNLAIKIGDEVSVSVSASDAETENLTYKWKGVFREIALTNADQSTATFVVPESLSSKSGGSLTLEVIVSDGDIDTRQQVVLSVSGTNNKPIINVEDQVVLPNSNVVIQAEVTDADNDQLSLSWIQIDVEEFKKHRVIPVPPESALELHGADSDSLSFIAPNVSEILELMFALTVNDTYDASSGYVKITVTDNLAPVLIVEDQDVLSGSSVEMVAKASDADGDVLNYMWLQKNGLEVELEGGTTEKASFTAPRVKEDTELTFDVMVNDLFSLVTETVTITIKANNAPILGEIADQSQDENKSVSLSASATDAEGDEVTYRWEQTSGTTVTLSNSNTSTASFTTPAVTADETLTFTVYASDGMAESSTATNVTVKNIATSTGGSTNNGNTSDSGSSGGSMGWLVGILSLLILSRRMMQ